MPGQKRWSIGTQLVGLAPCKIVNCAIFRVREVCQVTQNNSLSLAYAEGFARLLEQCILGVRPDVAVEKMAHRLTMHQELVELGEQLRQVKRKERDQIREQIKLLEQVGCVFSLGIRCGCNCLGQGASSRLEAE